MALTSPPTVSKTLKDILADLGLTVDGKSRDFRWDDFVYESGEDGKLTPRYPIHHGNPDDFGGADYVAALTAISQLHKEGVPGTPGLEEVRKDILSWLSNPDSGEKGGMKYLDPVNQPGMGGLYDRIKGSGHYRDINPLWGDHTKADALKFTHDDWLATQAMGFSQWQIKDWLRDSGPDYDNRKLLKPEDQPGKIGGLYNNIIQSIRGDLARIGRKDYKTNLGASASDFGGADYLAALRAGGPDTFGTRKDILRWLTESPEFLSYSNRPKEFRPEYDKDKPETYGLYERIKGEYHNRDINTFWGNWKQDTEAGKFFTHDDLLATRAMGFTDKEISGWLDSPDQKDVLRAEDKPGKAGGVYESIDRGILGNKTTEKVSYSGYTPVTTTRGESDLTIKIGEPLVGRRASGMELAKRKSTPYRQTMDLHRSALNI